MMKLFQTRDFIKRIMLEKYSKTLPVLKTVDTEPMLIRTDCMEEKFFGSRVPLTNSDDISVGWAWIYDEKLRNAVICEGNSLYVVSGLCYVLCAEDCQVVNKQMACQVHFKEKGEVYETDAEWLNSYAGPVLVQEGWNKSSSGKYLGEDGILFSLKSLLGKPLVGYMGGKYSQVTGRAVFQAELRDASGEIVAKLANGSFEFCVSEKSFIEGKAPDTPGSRKAFDVFKPYLAKEVTDAVKWVEDMAKHAVPDTLLVGTAYQVFQVNFVMENRNNEYWAKLLPYD